MAANVPCVRYAVAATASSHLGNRLQNEALKVQSLHMRLKATEALRRQLSDDVEETDISSLACIVLLAQLDLCSGDCLEFRTHLEAANTRIRRRGSDGTDRAFFQQRLAWVDIMLSTTSSMPPLLSPDDVESALSRFTTPGRRSWGFDVFECPVDLFGHLADVIHLQKLQRSSLITSNEVLKTVSALVHDVKIWTQACIQTQERSDITELWRDGILLYVYRLFNHPDRTLDTPRILDDIFQRATRLSLSRPRKFATSWPLFQAGLSLRGNDNNRKQWLRAEFMTQFRTLGCCNSRLATNVLERIWKTGNYALIGSQKLLF